MTATDPVQAVAKVLYDEGCAPGHDIHSWRCEDKERYPEPCDCVEQVAQEVVAAARPLIAAQVLREAADEWMQGHWADDLPPQDASRPQIILGMAQRAGAWLRDRAGRIEADDDHT